MPRLVPTTLLLALLLTSPARALTISIPITPDSIKQNPTTQPFKVEVEKRADNLLHFSITYTLPRPQYIVSTFTSDPITSTSAAVIRDDSASFSFVIAPDKITTTTFELATYSFGESGNHPVPVPGGTQYQFNISEFAKLAVDTSQTKTP